MKAEGNIQAEMTSDATFAMPAGMSIRYDPPAEALASCVTGYVVYRADSREPRVDWFLPAPAMICISLDAGSIIAQIGNHRFAPMPQASLVGATSRALRATTHGGAMIGIGISAVGWARLTPANAVDFHNRIVALPALLGDAVSERLVTALDATRSDAAVKALFDALLPPLFCRDDANIPLIAALMSRAVTQGVISVSDVADDLGIDSGALRRLSQRYFGMPPKLVFRRTRFLRSFLRYFETGDVTDHVGQGGGYYDMPHFLRDANAFLGTTPRRFMKHATPFLEASIRARAAVLGAGTQALHDSGSGNV